MKYQIFRQVNANAHNVRYGRDCHAPAVACGVVEAADEYAARDEAERLGLVYCPDAGQYEYLFDRAEAMGDDYKVVVDAVTGAHYDCSSIEEAHKTFDSAPVAQDGERLLIASGVIVRREYMTG